MHFSIRRALFWATLVFLALFAFRFADLVWMNTSNSETVYGNASNSNSFENSRKNYASQKQETKAAPAQGQPIGDTQKFEKIATLAQSTTAFDVDRARLDMLILANNALIQLERSQGLAGKRTINLGIGVPPEKFDGFIEQARKISKLTQLVVVKNDKTNEYLQLRAKRATLEKNRAALEKLQQPDGNVEDKLNILTRLTEVEQQIQELGVSLGDFDAANEFCTVKLTLSETVVTASANSLRHYFKTALNAFIWTVPNYLMAGIGLLALTCALWLGMLALRFVYKIARNAGSDID